MQTLYVWLLVFLAIFLSSVPVYIGGQKTDNAGLFEAGLVLSVFGGMGLIGVYVYWLITHWAT